MSPAFQPALAPPRAFEDPLAHLPCSPTFSFRKGQTIYDRENPSGNIYLILAGRVKILRPTEGERDVVIDIYKGDEFFGEAALLGMANRTDVAIAYDKTELMAWTPAEIEDLSATRPQLALGLMQLLLQRSVEFMVRIESLSLDKIDRRLAICLVRFARRIGSRGDNGSMQMIPLTHEFLGQYVGTSREIITHYMNIFRRSGYLDYSRRGINLHGNELETWISQNN